MQNYRSWHQLAPRPRPLNRSVIFIKVAFPWHKLRDVDKSELTREGEYEDVLVP